MSSKDALSKALMIIGAILMIGAYNGGLLLFVIPVLAFILVVAFVFYAWNSNDILLKSAGAVIGILILFIFLAMFTGLGLLAGLLSLGSLWQEIYKLVEIIQVNPLAYGILGLVLLVAGYAVKRVRIRRFHGKPEYIFR